MSCGSISTRSPAPSSRRCARPLPSSKASSTRSASPDSRRRRATAAFTCTCGSSRGGTRTRCGPRPWPLARELERRRPDLLTAQWWKEDRGERIFVDFNQNAPHKTVFGAWCVRARPGAQVSTPLRWDEIDAIHPDELTIASLPARIEADGDPWAVMNDDPQSLEPLLEMHERDRANGLMDAPWPPVYPKQPDEPPRVSRSRAKKT